MANDPPTNVEWGKPFDPEIAALIRMAVVLRDGPPDIAAPIDLGSRDFSDMQIHAFAADLMRRAGEYAGTMVGVFAMERILAGDDPNSDFWFRVMRAMANIGLAEPEPGDPLH